MKAFICITDFGAPAQVRGICAAINSATMFNAYVDENDVVVIPCPVAEIGDLMAQLAADERTNWVEYRVKFDI